VETDLLTLNFTGITGHITRTTKGLTKILIKNYECPSEAVANRTSLAARATTRNRHNNVNLFAESNQFERLTDDHLVRLTTEILFNGLVVYQNAATA